MTRPGPREILSVVRVMSGGHLMRYSGAYSSVTDKVERSFERLLNSKHCLTVNSGTSALICALVGVGVGPGDEVLVPAYTWVATAAAVIAVGALPVLVDIDETLTIDVADADRKITPRTKAIIPVHMLNLVCDMDAIMALAARRGLKVIEDAAQAVGVTYHGRRAGSIGDAGTFSFNQHKNITSGEGGAIFTDDDAVYERALMYHDVGSYIRPSASYHEPVFVGQNMRMTELGSAVIRPQLQRIDRLLARRRAQRRVVVEALTGVETSLRVSPHHDEDSAVGLTVIFPTPEQAHHFGTTRGAVNLIDTHRHVFVNWEPVQARRTYHRQANPFASADDNVVYGADDFQQTLDILRRTCSITLDPQIPVAAMKIQARLLARAAAQLTNG